MKILQLFPSAGIFIFAITGASQAQVSPLPIIGKVIEVTGQSWVINDLTPGLKTSLQVNSPLHSNDVVTTHSEAQITVTLGIREASLLIKKDSHVKVLYSPEKEWTLELTQGMLLSHIRLLANRPKHYFQVKTPSAVMGVRGTTFFVKAEPGKNLFLCTCIGTLSIDNKALIHSKHHDSPFEILKGNSPISSRLKKMEVGTDHTDAEARALAKLLEN